jgi:hypothetical protein
LEYAQSTNWRQLQIPLARIGWIDGLWLSGRHDEARSGCFERAKTGRLFSGRFAFIARFRIPTGQRSRGLRTEAVPLPQP